MRAYHALVIALVTFVATFSTLAPRARADVPVLVDGPTFAALCAEVGKAADCPTCRCEAITSTPAIGVTGEATDILHGILVEVRGPTSDGSKNVHEVHVFLGDDTRLVDGGVAVQRSGPAGAAASGDWEVRASKQVYDMCPGACDWDAVGQVHLFEIRESWREGPLSEDPTLDYTATSLIACFEHDKKPGCWSLELGMETVELTARPGSDKPKRGAKQARQRSWKVGGESGWELVLGKYTGNAVRTFAERSGREVGKKTMHFAELTSWADAVAITR